MTSSGNAPLATGLDGGKPKKRKKRKVLTGPRATVIAALIVTAVSVVGLVISLITNHVNHLASKPPQAPQLGIILNSEVPWCNKPPVITVQGDVPAGYKIVVFDSSADSNGNPTSSYSFDGTAQPIPGRPGQWEAPRDIYIGAPYRVDDKGKTILRHGKPESNAGFRAVVIATVLTDRDSLILNAVQSNSWQISAFPHPLAKATHVVTRTGDASNCKA